MKYIYSTRIFVYCSKINYTSIKIPKSKKNQIKSKVMYFVNIRFSMTDSLGKPEITMVGGIKSQLRARN